MVSKNARLPYDPFGGLGQFNIPHILSGWTMKYIPQRYEDHEKCPELCRDLIIDFSTFDVTKPMQAPIRYYMSQYTQTIEPEISFCDAYDTPRKAITEALRIIALRGAKPCEFVSLSMGLIRGYGKIVKPYDDTVHVSILIDDLSDEQKSQITIDKYGANAQDLWHLMAIVPIGEIKWI